MPTELRRPLPEGCLSDLVFDELLADELREPSAERVAQHVAECPRCRERLQALRRAQDDFLQRYRTAPRGPRRKTLRTYAVLSAGVTLALVSLLLVRRPPDDAAQGPLDGRSKGAPRLGFHVKRSGRVFQGANGEHVKAGDQLRFTVTNAPLRYVAVFSRDGSGAATVYYPPESRSRGLGSAPQTDLDAAVQLDGAQGEETLLGVFCDAPFELEPLRATLERTGKLPAMTGCSNDELRLVKDPE
jgi:hypothetical protein